MVRRPFHGVVVAALLCLLSGSVCRGVTEGTEVTERRLTLLRRLARECLVGQGLDAGTFGIARTVLSEFFKAEPDCPSAVVLAEPVTEESCRQAAREMTRELVDQKYPELDMGALEAEAAKKYPVHAEGDTVEVEFQMNPVRREKLRGVYQGRTPGSILVGRRQIMIADMAAVDGNEANILMFDAERSGQLRKEYIDQKVQAYDEARNKYTETVRAVARRERYRLGAQQNEQRGYLFLDGTWHPIRDAVTKVIEAERDRLRAEERQRAEQAVLALRQEAAAVGTAELAASELAPSTLATDPAAELAAVTALVDAEKKRAAVTEEEARRKAEEAAAEEARQKAAMETAKPSSPTPAAVETTVPKGLPWFFIAVIAVFVLGTVGAAVFAVLRRRSRDPNRFFQGKGRLQRSFWEQAEADPENFKYVAYRFPSMADARAALLHLSFISEAPGGQLKCHRDLQFGFYPHQDKFVCFVGGTELHYALWREASAVLPELPGAEYFRVSTAPEVMLEIPDIEQLLRDENLKVEHVENREGEGDDYSQYYVYKAPDKQNALEFLKRARVSEPGVHVIVQTPEGTWGKDENGIYQE